MILINFLVNKNIGPPPDETTPQQQAICRHSPELNSDEYLNCDLKDGIHSASPLSGQRWNGEKNFLVGGSKSIPPVIRFARGTGSQASTEYPGELEAIPDDEERMVQPDATLEKGLKLMQGWTLNGLLSGRRQKNA